MMSFYAFHHCKIIVFKHLMLSSHASYTVLMYKICVKYQYANQSVRAYAHVFRDKQGMHLLNHVLIRTNTVFHDQMIIYAILLITSELILHFIIPRITFLIVSIQHQK